MPELSFYQQVVLVILSGGGAAAIFTLVKALLAIRNSTDTREATGIGNLEKWRVDADKRAALAEKKSHFYQRLADYWWQRAGVAEYHARINGIELPPAGPVPEFNEETEPQV